MTASSLSTKTWPAAPQEFPVIHLHGVTVHALRQDQCVAHVHAALNHRRGGWVVTLNLDFLRRLAGDQAFADLCSQASLMVADGMPMVWASRLQGTPLPQRVAGSDLILSISQEAGRRQRGVYLLGGAAGTAQRAGRVLLERCPGLRVVGHCCPQLNRGDDVAALARITEELVRLRPDIVYVALGSPKQEELIHALRHHLPATWWVGVGISFSFLCGEVRRAPRWMQTCGLEWMHRLMQEPRRLGRRYLWHGLPFALRLLGGALLARWRRALAHPA